VKPEPRIETNIAIAAPAEQAWAVLAAFESYPEWNPLIRELRGDLTPGASIRVRLSRPSGKGSVVIRPTVVTFLNGEFRWLGRFISTRVLTGEHSFRVEPAGEGHSRFVQAETYRGILARLVVRVFGSTITRWFNTMNRSLRDRVQAETPLDRV
jgi:hypothetical protein